MPTIISEWIYCPVCGNKTRTMIREDPTELLRQILYFDNSTTNVELQS